MSHTESHPPPVQAMLDEITRLSPELAALRARFLLLLLAGVSALVVGITGALYQIYPDRQQILIVAIAVPLVLSFVFFHALNMIYSHKAKKLFVESIATAAGFHYKPGGIFPAGDAAIHKILPPHDKNRAEDGFEGTYNGVPLALQEVELSDMRPETKDHKGGEEMLLFRGLMAKIQMKRPFEGHTIVISHNAMQTFFRTKFTEFQRVRLTSSKFGDLFDVVSTDQVESRVILNPAFMERLMDAEKILKARWIEISFKNSEIMLAIQRSKPLFEVGPLWQRISEQGLRQSAEGLETLLRLIDVLRLNRQAGL